MPEETAVEAKQPDPDETMEVPGLKPEGQTASGIPDAEKTRVMPKPDEAAPESDVDEASEPDDAAPERDLDEEAAPEPDEPEAGESASPRRKRRRRKPKAAKPPRKRKRHKRRHRVLRVLLVLALIAAAVVVANLSYFTIQNVSVIGNEQVSDAEILRLAEIDDEQSILGLNMLLARHKIKLNPYIESVNINRKMPDTVEIIVTEKPAFAQLATPEEKGKTRKYVAIDSDGRVLEISEEKMKATYIKDVAVTKAKLRDKVEIKEEGAYLKAMDIIAVAQETDMFFKRISIKGSWVEARIYDDLMCEGRYANIIKALRAGTLKTVVYRLYQQNVDEGTVNVGDNNYCSFTPKK